MGDSGSAGAAAGARQRVRPQTVAPVAAAARRHRSDQRDQPTGAEALRVGALGAFKGWVAGGGVNFANLPMMSDLAHRCMGER